MELKNKTILIVSNEPWGDIWYSKHNWAYELSKNNLVFFINPPKRWRISNLFKKGIKIIDYNKNLKIFNYNNKLPFTRYKLFFNLNERIIYKTINEYFKQYNNIIFWTFDPYRLINPQKVKKNLSIYFIADKYLTKREATLIENSDYIISISKDLTDTLNITNALILSHGVSESEFEADKEVELSNFILYVGNINYRLNFELIEQLLKTFPQEKFLFIGKLEKVSDNNFKRIFVEKKYENLIYHPPVHFKELKNYIAKAKLCLSPMRTDVQGNDINHHKLLQYLAFGKPVLSSKLYDYKSNSLILQFETIEDAINIVKKTLKKKEDEELKNERINFTKQHIYDNLIKKIEKFIK